MEQNFPHQSGGSKHGEYENDDCQEHDLPLVRQARRGSGPLLCGGFSRQRGGRYLAGVPCLGLNGGPNIKHNEAFSFQISTEDQEETDRYWNAIVGNGGEENACGWCRDKWGISWQITPRDLMEAMATGGDEAKRAFAAMMDMRKIDVAAIKAARRG